MTQPPRWTGIPEDDLSEIVNRLSHLRDELRGRQIFVTGGTGFVGRWLLESFARLNACLELEGRMIVLSRDPQTFCRGAAHLANDPSLTFISGDVRSFHFGAPEHHGEPTALDFIIHAAADASETLNRDKPLTMMSVIVEGTRRVLDLAAYAKTKRLLFLSSGAVYGRQPPSLAHIPENYSGGPDVSDVRSAYGEAKRLAEVLCAGYRQKYGVDFVVARGFAFVGPHLPLDRHFAVGNFLFDALKGRAIAVRGDGAARRSYLYASDLAIWLWELLLAGAPGRAYNVGSEREISIAELADDVAHLSDPPLPVEIARRPDSAASPERYVPSTERARSELGLTESVDLQTALQKTYRWHRQASSFTASTNR